MMCNYGIVPLLVTKTVATGKGTSKREKIKWDGPVFLDPVWYGMLWYCTNCVVPSMRANYGIVP